MPTVQQWGRRESIIWPPRGYLYTLGAFFLACVATGFFVYLRFQFGLQPLQRYYLPYYLRSETAGIAHSASKYEMLYVSDGETPGRAALEADVQPGSTPQFGGKPLPLTLTPEAAVHGTYFLMREAPRNCQNRVIHAWIAHWIYGDVPLYNLFKMQLLFGLAAFVLQLPFSIHKDNVRAAHRQSVRVALEQLEMYTQARIGGNHPPETTAKFIAAKFEHDTARPVDGYVAPQLHMEWRS